MKKMAQSNVDETEESNAPYQPGFHGDQHQPGGHRKGAHMRAKGSTKGRDYIFVKLTLLGLTDISVIFFPLESKVNRVKKKKKIENYKP